ncbi:hypothetical protein ENH_00025000 [Eimeria necatrix]|uniref:Uncharacterized protein n=1 Tax=Eimeria necatrix TaxID=51315 RepID=U6MJX9_9EIME|nr:hypothetical protein ENH_00025000 [Eimeria necatrix]CDJ62764.1 hypothetical protein ENH_00025000 [Eimeria necatrix]
MARLPEGAPPPGLLATIARLQHLKRRGITVNANIDTSLDFKNPYLLEVSFEFSFNLISFILSIQFHVTFVYFISFILFNFIFSFFPFPKCSTWGWRELFFFVFYFHYFPFYLFFFFTI